MGGKFLPKWNDGKKHARNVYAYTEEEREEELAQLILDMDTERAGLRVTTEMSKL